MHVNKTTLGVDDVLSTYTDEWVALLSRGVTAVTVPELSAGLGVTPRAAREAIRRAKAKGWLFSPVRGLYVIVPPEYHSWGVVPGERFIDAAMRHAGVDYYVGYLSAAAHHGARHQAAQVFQVVADRRIRDREVGGLRIAYYHTAAIDPAGVETVRGEHGRWRVSTAEATLMDLLERPDRGGGRGNVLTIASALPLDAARLARAAERRGPAAARRAGWSLQRVGSRLDLEVLRSVAKVGAGPATPADPRAHPIGRVDRRWWIDENAEAEPDT